MGLKIMSLCVVKRKRHTHLIQNTSVSLRHTYLDVQNKKHLNIKLICLQVGWVVNRVDSDWGQ